MCRRKKRNPKNENEKKDRARLSIIFSAMTFCVLFIAMLIATVAVYLLSSAGVLTGMPQNGSNLMRMLLAMFILSNIIGLGLSYFVVKIPLKPVENTIDSINQLAEGDFKVRINYAAPFKSYYVFRDLEESVNKLAEELDNTEMLRSDFINNFSHEFKTPIVSIAGFAKLLKHGNLTEAQQREYLDIIEKESMRLSDMASNMLNMTRVENQAILSDVQVFNLSEQLRDCILLLVDKWETKNIEIQADFEEYEISANKELLKQVWVNLIDNAVKFSPEWGTVTFSIKRNENTISVSVGNSGEPIPQEKAERIFQKFYQADESHASEGNGIGLAIVQKVVQLHSGKISVKSENEMTVFTVTLPLT